MNKFNSPGNGPLFGRTQEDMLSLLGLGMGQSSDLCLERNLSSIKIMNYLISKGPVKKITPPPSVIFFKIV